MELPPNVCYFKRESSCKETIKQNPQKLTPGNVNNCALCTVVLSGSTEQKIETEKGTRNTLRI